MLALLLPNIIKGENPSRCEKGQVYTQAQPNSKVTEVIYNFMKRMPSKGGAQKKE